MSGWSTLSAQAFLTNQNLSDNKLFNGYSFSLSVSFLVSGYTLRNLHTQFLEKNLLPNNFDE